ncbi:DUF5133 domain-containing protein [Streptomyces virginiae]|uniref:DUF5133 domain-containing protein n=1 Tax=Streptomyces virginiae TaxID=1961 RepID=UPI0033AE648D
MTRELHPSSRLQERLAEPARSWAVGMLMATLPGPAYSAEQVLSAVAARTGLPVTEVARAMVAESRGTPLPVGLEQALNHAVQAARGSIAPRGPGTYLTPNRADAERALSRFFDARLRLRAAPSDPEARRAVDDAIYTLCVLMAQPSPYAAVNEALQYTDG